MIGAGVIATTALSSAIPGSASSEPGILVPPSPQAIAQDFAAGAAGFSAEGQALEKQLEPAQPAGDNLLLAVLSLEASTTTSEVQESMQRILELGVPQPAVSPQASLKVFMSQDGQEPPAAGAAVTATPEPEDEAASAEQRQVSEEETACAETGNPAYCIYTVVEGDTLSGIAQQLGFGGNGVISAAEMLAQSNKPDVVSSDHIEPGQNIRVPRESGILHTVLFSETASEIAADYGVSLDSLLASPYNALGGDGVVVIGQEVFVPDPGQLPVNEEVELTLEAPTPVPTPTLEATAEATATPEPTQQTEPVLPPDVPLLGAPDTPTPTPEPTEELTATPVPSEEATPIVPAPEADSFFIWPAQGPISSYFGPSHPLGIDIDLFDNPDAEIVAARGGEVVFAGGDPCCSYGYYVIVEHENGVQTLYAHLSRILVSEGQFVSQGQQLGIGGRTGYATGNHLHFEIRVNGNVVDPLKYLP
jgi:murein DD-endopeptidase MepM/ murein hydrolase activator NlpD